MTESNDQHAHAQDNAGYEHKDINVIKTLIGTVAVIVVIVVSVIFVDEIFVHTKERMIQEYVLVPKSIELRDLQANEDEVLNSYKVLDKAKDKYRIPISRAMKLMADEAYRQRAGER